MNERHRESALGACDPRPDCPNCRQRQRLRKGAGHKNRSPLRTLARRCGTDHIRHGIFLSRSSQKRTSGRPHGMAVKDTSTAIAFLDDATRPKAPKIEGITPAQRSQGKRLALIHDYHLSQMDEVRWVMEQVEAGAQSAATLLE